MHTNPVLGDPSFVERDRLNMTGMITIALDVGIMTGVFLFVALGLTLLRGE
jgi:hypothetical protein